MKLKFILIFVGWFFIHYNLSAQTSINPDISLIGTFNTFTNNIKDTPEYGKLNFETPGLELIFEGYLNPYARAAAVISYEDDAFAVEELYANIVRGLPLDVQIKAGKYLLGFGKINTVHPHVWSFFNRPLFQQIYFGEEGFNDIGLDLNFILPTEDFYSSITLGIYKGDVIANNTSGEGADVNEVRTNSPIFVGRLNSFYSFDDFNNLEIGLSGSYGNYAKSSFYIPEEVQYPVTNLNYLYGGFDFKYKYKPDSYTSLTIQGEAIVNNRDVLTDIETNPSAGKITTYGAFVYLDYQFFKQFSIGAKYDFTYGLIGDEPSYNKLANDDQNKTQGIETWIGYYPVEETLAIRLGLEHLMFSLADGSKKDSETTIKLQLLFSLGPHKAHQF